MPEYMTSWERTSLVVQQFEGEAMSACFKGKRKEKGQQKKQAQSL